MNRLTKFSRTLIITMFLILYIYHHELRNQFICYNVHVGYVTFGVYRFWRAYIDGYSALGVVYEVSLEVVMTTHA